MSHISILPQYRCQIYKAKAWAEVINNRSSSIGFFCKNHAGPALKEFNQRVAEGIRSRVPQV